jgi:hypothetical protein
MKKDSNNYTRFKIYNQAENRLTELDFDRIIYLSAMKGRVPLTAFSESFWLVGKSIRVCGEVHPGAIWLKGSDPIRSNPVCRLQLFECGVCIPRKMEVVPRFIAFPAEPFFC